MAKVKALRSFVTTDGTVKRGTMVEVDIHRHRALARNGLVPHPKGEEPGSAEPKTKRSAAKPKATKPAGKALTTPNRAPQRNKINIGKQ